jgi:hypothetical protein
MIFFKNKYLYYVPLILICSYYIFQSYFFGIHDFANYFFGGKFLNEGIFNKDIYFPYHFNKTITDFGYQNIFVSYAPNTPFLGIFFWIFSFFKIGASKLIFNSISSVLFIVSIYRLSNYHKIELKYILLLPFIFFIPIKNNLLFGQVYFLLFFLLSEGYLAYQKQYYKSLAVFWSLAIFLKVFPILFVMYLIFKKEYVATIYLTISCVILLLFSVFITGINVWLFYFSSVLNRANNGEIAGAFVDNYQSYYMFFKRLFVYDEMYNKNTLINLPKVFSIVILFLKFFLVGAGIFITRKERNTTIAFSFWAFISILISPYGSTYSFILLLFLGIILAKKTTAFNHKLLGFVLLFCIANSNLIPTISFTINYTRLFFLTALLLLFIWNYRKQIPFKKLFLSIVVLITITSFLKTEKTHFNTVLKTPILTYDYKVENNKISYSFWNENGENFKTENYTYQSLNSDAIEIIDNQIYYDQKQITFDNSNKKKAILINNKKILFLSDANLGIGFYGIKELDL